MPPFFSAALTASGEPVVWLPLLLSVFGAAAGGHGRERRESGSGNHQLPDARSVPL